MDLHDYPDVALNYELYLQAFEQNQQATGLTTDDVTNFHLDLASKFGSAGILDIGCGSGATVLPLVKAGYPVTAVDISSAMIEVLRDKLARLNQTSRELATLVCAGMEGFQLPTKFSFAFIARSGFMHLTTSSLQRQALTNIADHLEPGGILSLNTFYPNHQLIAEQLGRDGEYKLRASYTNYQGNREEIFNQVSFDPESQIIDGKWLFREFDRANNLVGERERPLRMRYTSKPEMAYLLELCGFSVKALYGNYRKAAPRYPGWLIWVAEKQ